MIQMIKAMRTSYRAITAGFPDKYLLKLNVTPERFVLALYFPFIEYMLSVGWNLWTLISVWKKKKKRCENSYLFVCLVASHGHGLVDQYIALSHYYRTKVFISW